MFLRLTAVVFLLLIGVVAVFQMNSLKRITEIVDAGREQDRYLSCLNAQFNLNDYSWDTFAPHVQAVNTAPVLDASADSLKALLGRLASLPGVRRVYYLENGRNLRSSSEPAPAGMADVLAGQREALGTYFQGYNRPTEKFHTMIQSRVRFLDVPFQGDTLRMIVGAFDPTGDPIHILPSLLTDPSQAQHLVALDLDPKWIRQAVAQKMDETFHSRWSFILWSPPPVDSTAQYLTGLGVIALGDTIWWRGLKSADPGLVLHSVIARESVWLSFVAVYQEDAVDLEGRTEYFHGYYIMLGLVDTAAVIFALLLVIGLVFIRKQWLARQTTLTHLAHAIRTPVARLRLDVDTLHEKRSVSLEEENEVIQSIGNECGRIERAVQNASLSLNGQEHVIQRSPSDLSVIFHDALRPWESSFRLAGIALELNHSLDPLPGRYDREMIITLLDNLLDNALRHTRISLQTNPGHAQKVIVSIRRENGLSVLTVDDSDGGVPENDRKRIFQRFERGSDAALSGASSLGLGLSLVKEIAEAHNGSVSVSESDLGGARFTVRLSLESPSATLRN